MDFSMKGKVIAVANMKGGVGKTATVVGLAEALAVAGHEILVIDLDAQANASMCLAGDQALAKLIEKARTIDAFVEDYMLKGRQIRFADCIRGQASDVTHLGAPLSISLLASSPALRLVERELIYKLTKQKFDLDQIINRLWDMMRDELKRTRKPYDYILIDCAPGISALTEVSIRLADLVIVPTIPDPLSSFGLQAFCNSLWDGQIAKRSPLKPPKARPHVLITRRRPIREHARMADILRQESYRENPAFAVFATEIPERAAIATALGKTGTNPAFTGKWGDEVVAVLQQLAAETLEVLHGE
jgi:chromosome partitioning protein